MAMRSLKKLSTAQVWMCSPNFIVPFVNLSSRTQPSENVCIRAAWSLVTPVVQTRLDYHARQENIYILYATDSFLFSLIVLKVLTANCKTIDVFAASSSRPHLPVAVSLLSSSTAPPLPFPIRHSTLHSFATRARPSQCQLILLFSVVPNLM